jgi:hypothetical protein
LDVTGSTATVNGSNILLAGEYTTFNGYGITGGNLTTDVFTSGNLNIGVGAPYEVAPLTVQEPSLNTGNIAAFFLASGNTSGSNGLFYTVGTTVPTGAAIITGYSGGSTNSTALDLIGEGNSANTTGNTHGVVKIFAASNQGTLTGDSLVLTVETNGGVKDSFYGNGTINVGAAGNLTGNATIGNLTVSNGLGGFPVVSGNLIVNSHGKLDIAFNPGGGGGVTSVSGTANQISSTGGTTPVLSLTNPLILPGNATWTDGGGNQTQVDIDSPGGTTATVNLHAMNNSLLLSYAESSGNIAINGTSNTTIGPTVPTGYWLDYAGSAIIITDNGTSGASQLNYVWTTGTPGTANTGNITSVGAYVLNNGNLSVSGSAVTVASGAHNVVTAGNTTNLFIYGGSGTGGQIKVEMWYFLHHL